MTVDPWTENFPVTVAHKRYGSSNSGSSNNNNGSNSKVNNSNINSTVNNSNINSTAVAAIMIVVIGTW